MTAGLSVANGLYGSNMQNYYNNPYFLQAYNSPNYNQMYGQQAMYGQPMYGQTMYGQQAYGQQPTNNVPTTQLPGTNNVSFQGAGNSISAETKEEKKGGNGLAWVLGIGATVAGTALWLASRGKARNATGIWNQIKLGATSLFKDPKILKGADIAKHKDALKLNDALKWTDDAAKIKNYTLNLTDGGKTYKAVIQNDKLKTLLEVTQENGKNKFNNITTTFAEGSIAENLKNLINTNIKAVSDKNAASIADGVLTNIVYTSPVSNGTATYLANVTRQGTQNGLRFVKAYV